MQAYKSHKTVEAAKIEGSNYNPNTDGLTLRLQGGEVVEAKSDWVGKHSEHGRIDLTGGYFVRYPDGYTSWSPAAAFEEGYTPHSLDPKDGALPVSGYKPQTGEKVDLVNAFKAAEERVLRMIDPLLRLPFPDIDQRWLAIGRTSIETGFMAVNRSIFQPGRVGALPEDAEPFAEAPAEG